MEFLAVRDTKSFSRFFQPRQPINAVGTIDIPFIGRVAGNHVKIEFREQDGQRLNRAVMRNSVLPDVTETDFSMTVDGQGYPP